jgi:hypothetical protein
LADSVLLPTTDSNGMRLAEECWPLMSVSALVTVPGEPLAGVMVQVSVPGVGRALLAVVFRTWP